MGSVYDVFATDKEAEESGIKLNYGDFSFLIARAGGANKRFQNLLEKRLAPHQRALQAGLMDERHARKILIECFAETVMLGWDGVTDREGMPIAYSKDACVALFLDLPDLFDEVREQAAKPANFRRAARELDGQD